MLFVHTWAERVNTADLKDRLNDRLGLVEAAVHELDERQRAMQLLPRRQAAVRDFAEVGR